MIMSYCSFLLLLHYFLVLISLSVGVSSSDMGVPEKLQISCSGNDRAVLVLDDINGQDGVEMHTSVATELEHNLLAR